MAKNVQGVIFLRNGNLFETREAALAVFTGSSSTLLTRLNDGEMALARYGSDSNVKTLAGIMYKNGANKSITIIDVEGASEDVQELREEINAKLGEGITSSNTATAQLAALSGGTFTPGTSSSAATSVEGAKAYAYDLVGTLDGGVTADTGYFVKSVSEVDGKISGTTEALPSYDDTAAAKKFVIAVDETNGKIAVERGEISSSAQTMVLTDNADGGVNFEVNIDGASIVQDPTSKKIKVADSALTQYFGDEKTIHAEVDATTNKKTFSTLLKITKNTNPSEANVKEEYNLVDTDGTPITGADTIKIYKDSSVVEIYVGTNYDSVNTTTGVIDKKQIGDVVNEHTIVAEDFQYLNYVYQKADGTYEMTKISLNSFLVEPEFKSGVTVSNGVVIGVVDPTSEKDSQGTQVDFLTVGTDGFKVSGIKNEIDRKLANVVADLDATVTGKTANQHISISIEELDGKLVQSGFSITEDNIADADDLAALSAKTVTEIDSSNASISAVSTASTDGTVKYDIVTDADKIQMSGFSADNATALSGIAQSDSIATAFEKTNAVITENERVTAEALTDLDTRVDTISGDVDTIKEQYISGVSVNSVAVTPANKVAPISISGSTAAPSGTVNDPAIIVNTNQQTGAITLGIGYIDCGTYDNDDPQP